MRRPAARWARHHRVRAGPCCTSVTWVRGAPAEHGTSRGAAPRGAPGIAAAAQRPRGGGLAASRLLIGGSTAACRWPRGVLAAASRQPRARHPHRGGAHGGAQGMPPQVANLLMALLHARFTHFLQQQFFEKVFWQNVPRTGPSDRGIYLTGYLFLCIWFAPRTKFVVHFVCPKGQVRGLFMFADFKVS